MAEPLTPDTELRNSGPNQAEYLAYIERHEDVDGEIADAKETVRSLNKRRKDLRKTIAADGYNLDAFDRALIDGKRSGEEREAEDRAYRQLMAWQEKPVGFQVDMFAETPEGSVAADKHRLQQIDKDGYAAGKAGHSATLNTFSPGTEQFSTWHSAWLRGQSEYVAETIKTPEEAPKKRGRPAVSGKKAKEDVVHAEARRVGYENGLAGHRDNAARWPSGEIGHGDYVLGHAQGEQEREEAVAATAAEPASEHEVLH